MTLKSDPTILTEIKEDEPIFILRTQDVLAPLIVLEWSKRLHIAGGSPEKIHGALECYSAMINWQKHNSCKIPD